MMKIFAIGLNLTCESYGLDYVEPDGTEPSLSSIIKAISKVSIDNKWRYQKIMERVKATCFSPHRTSSPDYKLGADNIAEHFQVYVAMHF